MDVVLLEALDAMHAWMKVSGYHADTPITIKAEAIP